MPTPTPAPASSEEDEGVQRKERPFIKGIDYTRTGRMSPLLLCQGWHGLLEQTRDSVGWLGAVGEPLLDRLSVDVSLLRQRVIPSQFLLGDETNEQTSRPGKKNNVCQLGFLPSTHSQTHAHTHTFSLILAVWRASTNLKSKALTLPARINRNQPVERAFLSSHALESKLG